MRQTRAAVPATLAVATVAATLLTGCGSDKEPASASAGSGTKPTKVRVGATSAVSFLPFYYALDSGIFKKKGLDVQYEVLTDTVPSLLGGGIDFSINGSDLAVSTAAQGRPTPIVSMVQQHNSIQLVGRAKEGSTARSGDWQSALKALPAKADVGVPALIGSAVAFNDMAFAAVGKKRGKDFTNVALGKPGNVIAALKAGQVDAVQTFPPNTQLVVKEGIGVVLVDPAKGEGGDQLQTPYGVASLSSPGYAEKNPETTRAYVSGLEESMKFVRENPADPGLLKIAAKYTGVSDPEVLAQSVKEMAPLFYPYFECGRMEAQAQMNVDNGTVNKAPTCDQMADVNFIPKSPAGWKG